MAVAIAEEVGIDDEDKLLMAPPVVRPVLDCDAELDSWFAAEDDPGVAEDGEAVLPELADVCVKAPVPTRLEDTIAELLPETDKV